MKANSLAAGRPLLGKPSIKIKTVLKASSTYKTSSAVLGSPTLTGKPAPAPKVVTFSAPLQKTEVPVAGSPVLRVR